MNNQLRSQHRELDGKENKSSGYIIEPSGIATVTVDQKLCISSYTPKATDIFHLMPSHKGRSFEHLSHKLLYDSIIDDIKKVLKDSGTVRKRVRSKEGRQFIMKLSPRHTNNTKTRGVVINFIEISENSVADYKIDELKNANRQLEEELKRNKLYQKEIQNLNIVERWNLGEYLHDNLGQVLVSAKIMLNDIGKRLRQSEMDLSGEISQVEDIIESGLQGIRNLSHEIVPIDIESEGVIHAFKHLLKRAEKLHNVNCILETDEITEKVRNRELITNLYRVAQEAINKAILNGRAKNVKAVIIEHEEQLYLHIKDDGANIPSSEEDPDELSIQVMKHRMELVGGTFKIRKLDDSDLYNNCITCTLSLEALESNGNS